MRESVPQIECTIDRSRMTAKSSMPRRIIAKLWKQRKKSKRKLLKVAEEENAFPSYGP